MARAAVGAALALAVSASSTPILIQTDAVSSAVASEMQLVQNFVNKFLAEKTAITEAEKLAFKDVYDLFEQTTLPNIASADQSDRDTLDRRVQDIRDCDKDVVSVKQGLELMSKEIDDCRAEEERLKGIREAALKALNDFRASLVAQPDMNLSLLQVGASAGAPGCSTPPVAEWGQFGTFFSRTSDWYATNAKQLHVLADASRAAIAAHEAQLKKCDGYQTDFEHKFCMWHSAVSKVTDEYAACRARTIKALDDTYPIVTEALKHRKADFTAVHHVQCLLGVLESDDADKEAGLRECMRTVIDTDHFNIAKPPVPPHVEEDLQNMINDIVDRHTGITADEEKVLDEAAALCYKDSVEIMQAKHDADVAQIAKELADVNQCDAVRVTMGEDVAQRNTVLAAARSDLQQHRAEEARLKGIMEDASAALEAFIVSSDGSRPQCAMPAASEKDAIDKYYDDREQFYTAQNKQYKQGRADLKAATEAYQAQVAVAAGKQAVFDARLCEWSAAVTKTRDTYKTCRDTTVPTLEATEASVKAHEAKRVDDWTQTLREECFIATLKKDPNDRDLQHECTVQDIDTAHLVVTYPETPAPATEALAALGDLSAESPSVPCPSA